MGADKLWCDVNGRPLLRMTLDALLAAGRFDAVIVATPRSRWDDVRDAARTTVETRLVEGGERRQDSVRLALAACADADWVCVHDAARPLVTATLTASVLDAAYGTGAATAAVPCVDTIKLVRDGHVEQTLERSRLVATQTPQAFRTELLARAHAQAVADGATGADDASLVERLGVAVRVVPGDPSNIKVTLPQDLELVRRLDAVHA